MSPRFHLIELTQKTSKTRQIIESTFETPHIHISIIESETRLCKNKEIKPIGSMVLVYMLT